MDKGTKAMFRNKTVSELKICFVDICWHEIAYSAYIQILSVTAKE